MRFMSEACDKTSHRDMKPIQFTLHDGKPMLLRPVIPEDRVRIK